MNLITDNINKIYLKFLVPSLGSAMVMSVYTMTDAIVVGKGVGADALAALSIVTPPLCILMAAGILFGVGGAVHMSSQRGMDHEKNALEFFTVSLISISAVTVALWIAYAVFMPQFMKLMGAEGILFDYTMQYMRYILMFFPVMVFSNYLAIFIRNDKDPVRAMLGVILGGVLNIILDILFVFPLHMGIGGASFASMLGMTLQVCVSASHFLSKKNTLRLVRPAKFLHKFKHIVLSGLSSFINELANGFIVFLFNIQILRYCGTTALAVYSVISNSVILFNSLFTGTGQAIQPVISANYGAQQNLRIRRAMKLASMTVLAMGLCFTLCGIVCPLAVSSVFLKVTPQISSISQYAIRLYFIAFLPMSFNVVATYYLQSILQTGPSFVISIMRNIVLSGLLILLLPLFLPSNVLWAIMPLVELLTVIVSMVFVLHRSALPQNHLPASA